LQNTQGYDEGEEMNMIKWDKPMLQRFKKKYNQECFTFDGDEHVFTFEGNEFVVGYAKYLIQHLEAAFKTVK
jgi:hypothetical protein